MDHSAINAIRNLSGAEQINRRLEELHQLKTPVIAIPESYKLADLEKFQELPSRFRANFDTRLINDFVEYVNHNGNDNTGVFIDPEKAKATAIINMGETIDPQWGDHIASLSLKNLPEYNALLDGHGSTLSQQDFIDFAEDWASNIQFIDAQEAQLDFKESIAANRKITVSATQNNEQSVGNFNAQHSSLDAIEVKAAGTALPYGFTFSCIPHDSFKQRVFVCQLRAITDGKSVSLKYRIAGLDQAVNDIGTEFKNKLIELIKFKANFYTGDMRYQK